MSTPKIAPAFAGQPVPREEYDRMADQRDTMRRELASVRSELEGLRDFKEQVIEYAESEDSANAWSDLLADMMAWGWIREREEPDE